MTDEAIIRITAGTGIRQPGPSPETLEMRLMNGAPR